MAEVKELWRKHYAKVLAFLAGWISEVLVDLSGWIKTVIERLAK